MLYCCMGIGIIQSAEAIQCRVTDTAERTLQREQRAAPACTTFCRTAQIKDE